jgi:hypothetical protein
MNGWQRLGVVAFLLWAPVAFVGTWMAAREGADYYYKHCTFIYKAWLDNNVPDRSEKSQQCMKEAAAAYAAFWDTGTEAFWRYVSLVITGPALVVWGLISAAIVTIRWIRKGFAQ